MKNYSTLLLVGIIVILAAVLTGVLVFTKNNPAQGRALQPIVEIAPMEPDSARWGINFPNQWASLQQTEFNNIDTTYGGSSKFSWLERDPRQKILFAGYPFSKEYNDDRGHMNMLTDVRETDRLNLNDEDPKHTPATCYSCKSGNNPALWDEMGMAAFDAMSFNEMTPNIETPIGCANCHVEYYFAGKEKYLTFPWANGTEIDQIIAYYEELGFSDWTYPDAGTPMLKAQHPEYEFFTAGSTHYNAGVSCADCHMPYVSDGAAKYSSHDVHSPLINPQQSCGQCHTDVDYVVRRVNLIQDQVNTTKIATEDAIIDAINGIKAAAANPNADQALLDQARNLHRKAQFMWDFLSAENSTGFHNPEYALKICAEATNFARQAQMLAAQAANDPSLLTTGTYYLTTP